MKIATTGIILTLISLAKKKEREPEEKSNSHMTFFGTCTLCKKGKIPYCLFFLGFLLLLIAVSSSCLWDFFFLGQQKKQVINIIFFFAMSTVVLLITHN